MFASVPVSVFLLPILLSLTPCADAAASLTPPAESSTSTTESIELSVSFTPISSGGASGSSSSGATATSSAQFPSLSGLSDCASRCFGLAISQDGCDSIVDVNCYCANPSRFTSGLVACISTECPTPGNFTSVESISQQFCALASQSTSLSFPTPPPSTTFSDPFTSSLGTSSNASTTTSHSSSSSTATSPPSSTTTGAGGNNSAESVRLTGLSGILGLALALAGTFYV